MPHNIIIAIDPDLTKSGVAMYDAKEAKFIGTMNLPLWDLFMFMRTNNSWKYMIENGDLVKGNWHGAKTRANVGKGNAVAKLISDYAEHLDLKRVILKPDGYSLYFNNNKRFEEVTGLKGSNPETRAAAAIIIKNKHLIKSNIWN